MRLAGSIALAGALVLVQTPVLAKGSAEALGVMSVSLDEVVKPQLGIQGLMQGAAHRPAPGKRRPLFLLLVCVPSYGAFW